MSRNISTELAPAAIGPYVQGVDLGSMIITSGQIPVDPKTGAVADDVAALIPVILQATWVLAALFGPSLGLTPYGALQATFKSAPGRFATHPRIDLE
jgi:enamine deaminase RidA (YjgF/YER057c/UK114 family)